MSIEVTLERAEIMEKSDVIYVGKKDTPKVTIRVSIEDRYGDIVLDVEFLGDERLDIVDTFESGDEVRIRCDLRGRLWENKEGVM